MELWIIALPLFVIQFVLLMCNKQWFHKHRAVLLILPALYFIVFIIPGLFHTYEGVAPGENAKMNVVHALVECMYVLVLLVPFAFTFVKKTGWRVLLIALLMLNMPLLHSGIPDTSEACCFGFPLYSVKFQYLDTTAPYVKFEWNWPNEPYM